MPLEHPKMIFSSKIHKQDQGNSRLSTSLSSILLGIFTTANPMTLHPLKFGLELPLLVVFITACECVVLFFEDVHSSHDSHAHP